MSGRKGTLTNSKSTEAERQDEMSDAVDGDTIETPISRISLSTLQLDGHVHSETRVRINVSGRIFVTRESTLNRFPCTLLGSPERRQEFYWPEYNEYFFDRHSDAFPYILHFYQNNGCLHAPPTVPLTIFLEEVKFFGLHSAQSKNVFADLGKPNLVHYSYQPEHRVVKFMWELLNEPSSSRLALAFTIMSILVVLLSIATACLETLPDWENYDIRRNASNSNTSTWKIRSADFIYHDSFFIVECVTFGWFLIEFVVRFIVSPLKRYFFINFLNIIDAISILTQLVGIILDLLSEMMPDNPPNISAVRMLRLLRIFRILKLSRHSKGLQVMGLTLKASFKELLLLLFVVAVSTVLFGSFMYYCESDAQPALFRSIPHSFWYVVVTMTTVGYGDMYPISWQGKLVGAVCTLCGVLAIALAVPVIVNNFLNYYTIYRQGDIKPETHIKSVNFRHSFYQRRLRVTETECPDHPARETTTECRPVLDQQDRVAGVHVLVSAL